MWKDDDDEGTDDVTVCWGYALDEEHSFTASNLPETVGTSEQALDTFFATAFGNPPSFNWDIAVVKYHGPEKWEVECKDVPPWSTYTHEISFYIAGSSKQNGTGKCLVALKVGFLNGGPLGGLASNPDFNRTVAHEISHADLVLNPEDNNHIDWYGDEALLNEALDAIIDVVHHDDLNIPVHETCKAELRKKIKAFYKELATGDHLMNYNIMWFAQSKAEGMRIRESQLEW